MQSETLMVDGAVPRALRVYAPRPGPARAAVVIGGAMGVRQAFYGPFAAWLAQQGLRVTTFDYRGQGESLTGGMREVRANLFDWARDYDAVIAHAAQALPGQPLLLLGHSLGAQLPGLLREHARVSGLLSVAAGSGYWRDNAPRIRRAMPAFWHVLVPLSVRLCGYFPGRRLRAVGDLPAGVMLQWRRWCLHPRYSVGAEGESAQRSYAAVRFPVHAWSMQDDELMTWRGTQSLLALYANAPCSVERIAPHEAQARRIGHFGFFREQFRDTLWPRALQQLEALAQAQPQGTAGATATAG